MPKVGFEPTRANAHYALNVARLPVPPLRLEIVCARYCTPFQGFVNAPNPRRSVLRRWWAATQVNNSDPLRAIILRSSVEFACWMLPRIRLHKK